MRKGDSDQAKASAANSLLDRGWGKPTQPLAGDETMAPIGTFDVVGELISAIDRRRKGRVIEHDAEVRRLN
jgi:hypothetical protein